MKIITWNCNGAFRQKYHLLEKFNADILVIQECENPLNHRSQEYTLWCQNYVWIGANVNKGLAIFAKPQVKIEKLYWPDNDLKFFLPVRVNDSFDLVACWCHGANSPTFGYIGQLWKYLKLNKSLMKNAVVVGDLNSNKIWDVWDRWWNHSDVIRELKEIGIRSLYHEFFKEEQGEESQPTFYLQRNILKLYHVDYVFAPFKLVPHCECLKIGTAGEWLTYSDHMPLIFKCEVISLKKVVS